MDSYDVGDYLSDSYCIYKIIDINKGEDVKGNECDLVKYKPVWSSGKDYVGQIPVNCLEKTGMRKVLTVKEIKKIMSEVDQNESSQTYDYNSAKESVYQNDPIKVLTILKYLWMNKSSPNRGDKDLMEKIIDNLSKEISFVSKVKYGVAKKNIVNQLNKLK